MSPAVAYLAIRLLPDPTTTGQHFTNYLNGLVITAYDQTIISIDPQTEPNAPGTQEFELGVASGPVWQAPNIAPHPFPQVPVVNLNPPSSPNGLPTLDATIFQHFEYFSNSDTPSPLAVATAFIPVNIPGLNTTAPLPPSPYPQYPTNTSYDVRLSMVRNQIALPEPPIQWNVTVAQISYTAGFTTPIVIPLSEILGAPPSMYVLVPNPPPTGAAASSTINLSDDGTPPKFEDLVQAINPVLKAYSLAGAASLASLTVPLTKNQCQTIAQKIAWNPSLTQLPNPIPPYPSPPKYASPNSTLHIILFGVWEGGQDASILSHIHFDQIHT
jgi:hypothetical protein